MSELKKIKDEFKRLKEGQPEGFLRLEKAKPLLKRLLKIEGDWKQIEEVCGAKQHTIDKALCYHSLSKSRKPRVKYSDEALKFVIDTCLASQDYSYYAREDRPILKRLKEKLFEELNMNKNKLKMLKQSLTQKDLDRLGGKYKEIELPLKWASAKKGVVRSDKKTSEKNIKNRMKELINLGILLKENGKEVLYTNLEKEFPGNKLDKRKFKGFVKKTIWEQRTIDSVLQDIVRDNASKRFNVQKIAKKFRIAYPNITDEFIEPRAKWHKGLVSGRAKRIMGTSLPGIGRIDLKSAMPDFKIPQTTFKKPFEIKLSSDDWSAMFLNGANLGIKYGPDIMGNVARKALSDAEAWKDDLVILTNFLCFDLKKAGGPAKTARAQILGDSVNPDIIQDKDYRKIVERIIELNPVDEIIYRTPEELVSDVLGGGWSKISTIPGDLDEGTKEKPEYSGPIYIAIGLNELSLIFTVTYWEIRWWTIKKQQELDEKIGLKKKALANSRRSLENDETNPDLYKEVAESEEGLQSLEYQRSITTISAVANQESQRFFEYAYSVVIQKIEEAIPNAKVIGEGTNYLKVNDQIIKIYIPSHLRITDGLLSDYAASYGPDVLREENPDAVVVCHPWALQFRATGRETDHDGKRDSMKVYVAPIAVDDRHLRSELSSLRFKDHPIMKAVYNHMFKSGVLRLRSGNKIIDVDEIPVEALESFKNYPKTSKPSVFNSVSKNLWFFCCSDHHWGGRSKEFVWDAKKKIRVSMAEAVFEMMRREGLCNDNNMPVHFLLSPDDPTQAQNIKYRTEPHPHQMTYALIEKITGSLLVKAGGAKTKKSILKMTEQIRNLALYQFEKRGSDYLIEQLMQMMERHIEPNLDVFSAILRRAQSADLIIKGVGDIAVPEYGGHDSRNIGFINIGTGNHFSRTTDSEMIEGPLYSQRLRDLLCGMDEWKGKEELIKKVVLSPIYGQTCIGWGVISTKGGHEYGIEVRSSPTNMAGWGDTLRGHVKKDLQRGNYSRIWNKKLPILKFFGDKHFFGGVSTGYSIYHMSPAAVHTDAYGERGFPPNNTGVSFLGVPADGPDKGPIYWRFLPFEVIKDFMEDNPRPFDWEKYLPNPA